MKRPQLSSWRLWKILLGIILMLVLISPISWAQSMQELPNPRQQNGSWISDRAELLSPESEAQLNRRINQLAARTTAELAIANLPQLESTQSSHEFALTLFNAWKIGNRFKNNGVLLLLIKENRRIEVMTGRGLQEILPDAEVSRLIQQDILPALQQTEYELGIQQGTFAIAQHLEARSPKTWLPSFVAGIIAIVGITIAAIGYLAIARFVRIPVYKAIPAQGFDQNTFQNSVSDLKTISLTELWIRLFNLDTGKAQSPPQWMRVCPGVGGTMLGLAIALGWQSLLVPADIWGNEWITILSWFVNIFAGLIGLLLPALLLLPNKRDDFSLLLLIGLFPAFLGGAYITTRVPAWPWIILTILLANGLGTVIWLLASESLLTYQRQWQYQSDRSQQPIQELTPQELNIVLSPAEQMAMAMDNLIFRGWRSADLSPPFAKEQVYLVQAKTWGAIVCAQCRSLTIEKSTQTIEKTVRTEKKKKRKSQEQPETAVIEMNQTTYTCHFCGHHWIHESPVRQANHYSSDYGSSQNDSASEYVSNYQERNTSDDYYDRYNNTYDNNSSGSDFGGGSSDGSGAGSDW